MLGLGEHFLAEVNIQANNPRQLGLFQGQDWVLLRRAVIHPRLGAQRVELVGDLGTPSDSPIMD
ncbi:MAG: hypothetical protein IPQ22_17895 [Rhodoferax sp.]|nr:hypothetical protein [Rhodoferax sp.]